MDETTERDLRVCKDCLQTKVRIQDGRYPNSKNRKFIDELGQLWNGRVCGTCHATRQKDNQRKKRS